MGESPSALDTVRALEKRGKYRDALVAAESIDAKALSPSDAAELSYVRGELCNQLGRVDEAEAHLHEATLGAAQVGDDGLAAKAWVLLIEVVGYKQERYEEGMALRHTVEFALTRAGDDLVLRAMLLNNLANVLDAKESYAEALPYHRQALTLIENAENASKADVAKLINNLSNSLFFHERYDESIELDKRALGLRKDMFGEHHPEYAKSVANLGGSMHATKRYAEAEPLYRQSIDILVGTVGEASPTLGNSHHNLGEMLVDMGRLEEARPHLIRAATIFEGAFGEDHRHTQNALENLERCEKGLSPAPQLPACDRYRFVSLVGSGGMGEVYKAFALGADGFKKPVAIKRLLPSLAGDPLFVRRFTEEAKLLVGLGHRNIVNVLDLVRAQGDLLIALELVEGVDLRRLQQTKTKLAPGLVCYMVSEVCRGLAFAHTRGIVHADMSPANVLLSTAGDVKVTDFGIARRAGVVRKTIEGKWAYMAPEQARGEALTARADAFSVGVVLFELLTGAHPWPGATATQLASLHAKGPPETCSKLPGGTEELCRALLAAEPGDRPTSLSEVARQLDRIASHCGWSAGADELGEAVVRAQRSDAHIEAAEDTLGMLDTEVSAHRSNLAGE